MKRTVSVLLVLVSLFACISCDSGNGKGSPDSAETVAKKYVEHLYNAEFQKTEDYVAIPSDTVLKESAKLYPDDLTYDNGRIEIDGESFESVRDMIKKAEQLGESFSLASAKVKSAKAITREELEKKLDGNKLAETLVNALDEKALENIVTVEVDVKTKMMGNDNEGTVNVILINMSGEWKVLSPTWISWIILGQDTVK